jgi:hypothetical protein
MSLTKGQPLISKHCVGCVETLCCPGRNDEVEIQRFA